MVRGSTSSEGIVEMCLGGYYGYISQKFISTDYKKGILTCRQLGYDPAGEKSIDAYMTHTQTSTTIAIYKSFLIHRCSTIQWYKEYYHIW